MAGGSLVRVYEEKDTKGGCLCGGIGASHWED